MQYAYLFKKKKKKVSFFLLFCHHYSLNTNTVKESIYAPEIHTASRICVPLSGNLK